MLIDGESLPGLTEYNASSLFRAVNREEALYFGSLPRRSPNSAYDRASWTDEPEQKGVG